MGSAHDAETVTRTPNPGLCASRLNGRLAVAAGLPFLGRQPDDVFLVHESAFMLHTSNFSIANTIRKV